MSEASSALLKHGWEVKAGLWHAPTARGLVPMWSDEIVTGDTPRDADSRRHQRVVRASIEPLYHKAWNRWLEGSLLHKSGEFGMSLLDSQEQKALAEGTDTSGGFAVPGEFAANIIVIQRQASLVRQKAIILPTSRDFLQLTVLDNASEWVGEVPTSADTPSIVINALGIPIRKARTKITVSNDLLADQPATIEWLTRMAGINLARLEEGAFVAGPLITGSGALQPMGFMNAMVDTNSPPSVTGYASNTVDVTGTTAHTISNTVTNLGSVTGLLSLEANLPSAYRLNATWFTKGPTLAKVRGLIDFQSRPIFLSQGNADGQDTLMAHPITTSSEITADGTSYARVIGLVDLSQYVIATRNLLSVRIATETYGDTDQTLVYVYDRIGGTLGFADAIRVGTVS